MMVQRSLPASLSAHRQSRLLFSLWWRHLRRRAIRVGDAPKLSGVPGFLLMGLISVGYLSPFTWSSVARDVDREPAFFAWHMLAMLASMAGAGVMKATSALQIRGTRNDAFLEALPLSSAALLALHVGDSYLLVLLALVVPLAALQVLGGSVLAVVLATGLALLACIACFVLAYTLVSWVRALGRASIVRPIGYGGVALNIGGMTLAIIPAPLAELDVAAASALTRFWLSGSLSLLFAYVGPLLMVATSYRVLLAAERMGFDRIASHGRAPKRAKRPRSRAALELQLMWRHGGNITFYLFVIVLCGAAWLMLRGPFASLVRTLGLPLTGLAVYLGTLVTLTQAGRSARSDLSTRSFLSALPLLPHQMLDGKARALRLLVAPVFAMLALMTCASVWHGELAIAYRSSLAFAALYVVIGSAIGIAFLSSGIGMVGVAGGQVSSSFSTQLIMMPLFTTVLAPSHWAASVSFIAVLAVARETRRAAQLSVRWLEDSDDQVERETTVWRAMLAATAFFAMQVLGARLLDLFDVPPGYMLAGAFGTAAAVLALMTFRNGGRFDVPRFMPRRLWAWPVGLLAGAGSGALALSFASIAPRVDGGQLDLSLSSPGEHIAVLTTMIVVAPLAEEYFFRGWLQKAIERDLPVEHKRWAFALGALAFALAHVGTYGVPQLVLGLAAGALYAAGGGLWPAILAHAMHNGVVLLAADWVAR
jgi:membrane protease YdiL (CAAX protease family)